MSARDGDAPRQDGDGGAAANRTSDIATPVSGRDFLRHVLPEPGHGFYCLGHLHRASGKGKDPFGHDVLATIDAMAAKAEARAFDAGVDVYFALFTLREREVRDAKKGRNAVRVKPNMAWCRCLFLDLDCGSGKDYADQRTASTTLKAFVAATRLPRPTVVSSGNGLHVYFTLDRALPAKNWGDLADRFKRLVDAHGLKVDRSKLVDVTSVLRVDGTFNRKDPVSPKRVRAGQLNPHTPMEELTARIEEALARCPAIDPKPTLHDYSDAAAIATGEKPAGWTERTPPPETPETVAWIGAMLAVLDPDADRSTWMRVVYATLASRVSSAVELAREWSMRGEKWEEGAFDALVASFDPTREGAIGFGTLVMMAKAAGYTGPLPSQASAGAVVGAGDGIQRPIIIVGKGEIASTASKAEDV